MTSESTAEAVLWTVDQKLFTLQSTLFHLSGIAGKSLDVIKHELFLTVIVYIHVQASPLR